MQLNLLRLERLLEELSRDVGGSCFEASVFIGEIKGKPIRLTVMSKSEARESHDYSGVLPEHECIEGQIKGDNHVRK